MREHSETEEQLQRLFRPLFGIVRGMCSPLRHLGILWEPFRWLWNRIWSYVLADGVPSAGGFAQKVAYQRIMLAGQLVVVLCVVVVFFRIRFGESDTVTLTNARTPVTIADMYVPDRASVADTGDIPGAHVNVPRWVAQHNGFLGFRHLTPTHIEIHEPTDESPSEIYAARDDKPYLPDDPISFSPVEGEADTVVIPVDADFEWSERGADAEPKPELITRGPALIRKVMPDVPPSAKMMGVSGYVEVLALIGPDGTYAHFAVHAVDSENTQPECVLEIVLKNGSTASLEFYVDPDSTKNELLYVKLEEDPDDSRFAEYLFMVLPEWRFSVPLYESRPTYAFVRIGFNFCASDDADCQAIILIPS